jgi:hypothetical protein
MVSSLSTLSAAEPLSPTQQYQANLQRIEQRIADKTAQKNNILERSVLFEYSDQHDLSKPESTALIAVQTQQEINRIKYARELTKLKRELKKLSKEKKKLESTQIYSQ